MIRVVLVDDHVVVRVGIAKILSFENDLEVAGHYSNTAEAWRALSRDDVNVAVLGTTMSDESGLYRLKQLRSQKNEVRVIILSIYRTSLFVKGALDAGVSGYLTKWCGAEELVQAVRSVGSGGHYLCADALRSLSEMNNQREVLTPREREVFDLLIRGASIKEIAFKLDLSHKTVHAHRANVLGKFQCQNNVELLRFALDHRLLME